MGGHVNGGTALESVFALPKNSGGLKGKFWSGLGRIQETGTAHLILSVEIDATPSIERNICKQTGLIPAPREHRQWHGDRNVNSNLSHINLPLVFPGSSTGLGEDGGSVPILVLVDDLESLVESLGVEDDEDGSEDLFVITLHCGIGFDDGRSDEVSVWITFDLNIASVQDDLSAFGLSGVDESEYTVFGSRRNDRTPVRAERYRCEKERKTHKSVLGSKPPLTRSFEARSMRPGRNSLASPTRTATEIAIHR